MFEGEGEGLTFDNQNRGTMLNDSQSIIEMSHPY